MLISFHVKNFRSIVDTTVSLNYAEGKAPNGYEEMSALPFFDIGSSKKRVVPCLALYGANASGKTNLIKAIKGLNDFLDTGIDNIFAPNKLHSDCRSTLFEVNFYKEKNLFSYSVEYNSENIIRESLKKGNKILFSIENYRVVDVRNIVTSSYPIKKLEDILKVECSNASGIQTHSFLSKIGKQYAGLNTDISASASFFFSSIYVFLTNDFPMGMGIDLLTRQLKTENAYSDALSKIEKFIQKMDFGIKQMKFDREKLRLNEEGNFDLNSGKGKPVNFKSSNNESYADYLYAYHDDINGNEVCFNFNEESNGTRTAFGVIGVILFALENGNIVCIDELDRSLHSLVFREIVRLFKDKRYNAKGAQLIFTAHNTDLLEAEILRVSEVGIVSKNLKHGTTLTRLSEFDGIRNVLNFRKKYLNGEFAGIPFPYI